MFLQIIVSYIDSSRGICVRRWCKDVHHCRAGYRLRHGCECCVWNNLLDNNIVLIVGRGLAPAAKKRLDRLGQAFWFSQEYTLQYLQCGNQERRIIY